MFAHWNNSPWVAMSLPSDTSSWFRANQFLLSFLKAACSAEKQQISISKSLGWPVCGSNPWSTALVVSMLTITLPMSLLRCIRGERHGYPRTVISVSKHNKDPSTGKRVSLVQSGHHHHLIKCSLFCPDIAEKLLTHYRHLIYFIYFILLL
jgi:hypothetical protein